MEDRYIDLVKEGIDLAIRVGPLEDSSLIARKIGTSKRVVVASSAYLHQARFPQEPADLNHMNACATLCSNHPTNGSSAVDSHGDESVQVDGRFKASSNEALIEAALTGLGIATMCDWHVRRTCKTRTSHGTNERVPIDTL